MMTRAEQAPGKPVLQQERAASYRSIMLAALCSSLPLFCHAAAAHSLGDRVVALEAAHLFEGVSGGLYVGHR